MKIELTVKENPRYKIIVFRNKANEIGFQLVRDTLIDRLCNFGGYNYMHTEWIDERESIEECGKKLLEQIWKCLEDNEVTNKVMSNSNQYLLAVVDSIKSNV